MSNRKHGDSRDSDTDPEKYMQNIPRGNHNYISYICIHRNINHSTADDTSLPSNALWANSYRTNGDGRKSNDQDSTGKKKKNSRDIFNFLNTQVNVL